MEGSWFVFLCGRDSFSFGWTVNIIAESVGRLCCQRFVIMRFSSPHPWPVWSICLLFFFFFLKTDRSACWSSRSRCAVPVETQTSQPSPVQIQAPAAFSLAGKTFARNNKTKEKLTQRLLLYSKQLFFLKTTAFKTVTGSTHCETASAGSWRSSADDEVVGMQCTCGWMQLVARSDYICSLKLLGYLLGQRHY